MIRLGKNLNITIKLKDAVWDTVGRNVYNAVWDSMWVYFRNALRNTVRYNLDDQIK